VVTWLERMPEYTREALEELEVEFSFPHRVAGAQHNEWRRTPAPVAAMPPTVN